MPRIAIAKKDISFDCADDDTILRAALRAGVGLGYDCNVGSCGNCRFELLSGRVTHLRENPPGLSEADKERNRYLGCQARADTDCMIKLPVRDDFAPAIRPRRLSAVLIGHRDITHDMREFRFRLDVPQPFLPGQYVLLSLPGSGIQRAYSLSNADTDAEWHLCVRRVVGGEMTAALFDRMQIGQQVAFDGPYGRAFLREDVPRDVLCIAGGSGLAPMLSIARAFSRRRLMKPYKLRFFYGARTPADVCGRSDLELLPEFGSRIHYDAVVSDESNSDGWTGSVGMVADLVSLTLGETLKNHEIYFAGPPAMADSVTKMALGRGVSMSQMHYDRFY